MGPLTNVARGACLCTQLSYEVTLPTKWAAHCHCSMCRRAHGAAFVTWFGVADWSFRISRGAECLTWYKSTPEGRRGFCNQCGTPLLFRSSRWPGETHIAYATLATPIDRKPESHAFWDAHVDWVELADRLPRKPGQQSTGS